MKKSLISIIIPNFNKEKFVKEALLSLKAQTYTHFEAIIVDDASTDASVEIIKETIKDDARFSFIQQVKGQGGSAARNLGFSKAKGEYILFFDSDDYLVPTCLEQRIQAFEMDGTSNCDFIVSPMGSFKEKIGDSSWTWMPKQNQDDVLKFLAHQMPWSIMQPLWRRAFLEKLKVEKSLGPFDVAYVRLQDIEMHTRALLANAKYKIVENISPDCYYRIDFTRTSMHREDQLSRQMKGFGTYLQKMNAFILSKSRNYKSALRLTFFEALVILCYWQNQGEVTKTFVQEEVDKLMLIAKELQLLNFYHLFLVKFYCVFLRGRIRGMNWAMRKLISYL